MAAADSRMPDARTIRIFISSPADVRPERLKAEQIIARLNREFAHHFHVEAVLWEREPLVAARHFQDPKNIPPPRGMDIVAVILWSRLGVLLPEEDFRGAISGRPVTGTEWEFEDALAGARESNGIPDLLLYRKTARPVAEIDDRSAVKQRLEQLDMIEEFIARWFRNADDQSFTAASHSFATTAEFEELLYNHLRALLERRAGASTAGLAIRWHEAPFRGLLPFEYEHSPVFFGRTRARNELRELLARRAAAGSAFVLVFGASGSGKSSLVKAGLLPDLMLPGMIGRVGLVRWGLTRPSDSAADPLDGLAAAILSATALPELGGLQYTTERLAALLREAPGQAAMPIRQGLAVAGAAAGLTETAEARLALVVDQLEELFTVEGFGDEARQAYIAALEALARSGLVWVVATMRSDFFDRLEKLPALAMLSGGEARYLLLPPNGAEIGQIIRQPALEAGLRFDVDADSKSGLDETVRQAAVSQHGALPLLSFLLDQLWQRRGEGGLLTFAAYEELGGLEGAIGRRAEEVFQAQPAAVQKELVPVLHALVTVEGSTATSRSAPRALFPAGSPRRQLVDAFLHPEARLLVADNDAGEVRLRLVHEALLSHWPRARDQVAADARDLELRGRLEQEAERWRAAPPRDKPRRVIAGLVLAEARELMVRWGAELPDELREFVTASLQAARRRRLRLAATVAAAVVAGPLIALIVWAGLVWSGVRQVEAEMAFVPIPAGCFEMGSPGNEEGRYENEQPVRKVCLKGFDLGQFSVTQQQWRRVMVLNASPAEYKGDDHPVESVSWDEVHQFARLMTLFGRRLYRLPSEAEREYAARAGTATARYWGERAEDGCPYENTADLSLKKQNPEFIVANCDDGYVHTAPVGKFKSNAFGLNDMLGNVAEWVEDCYVKDYAGALTDGSPVTAPDCSARVIRGGSWDSSPRDVRAAYRYNYSPGGRLDDIGVRLARTMAP
jgi:formylglycine-generating enzyme required for sulfatase activity